MKIIIFIVLTLIFCLPIYAQEYFPLKIGNVWHYELSNWNSVDKDTFSIFIIGDTLMPNGKDYYVLNKSLDPAGLLSPFVRVDSSFIYFFDLTDSTDTPVYDFNADIGEYYNIGLYATESDSPRVQLSSFDTTQIFGKVSENVNFYLDWLVPFDLSFSKKFGPLGWYSAHHEPVWTNLIGCTISGFNYGFILGLENFSQNFIDFYLEQNYPNPFNSTTVIKYYLPSQSKVEMKLFNAEGKLVKVLVDEIKKSGSHVIELNSNNLASGIYFYQMNTEKYVDARKLLLLK
jgi:hypothetical protein